MFFNSDRLGGAQTMKEACQQKAIRRSEANYIQYIDSMQSALNKNLQDNVLPYWREHNSLKGWTSMNYPTTMQSPQLERYKPSIEQEFKAFSNQERPVSHPVKSIHRPFTGAVLEGSLKPLPIKSALTKAGMESLTDEIKALYRTNDTISQAAELKYGKSQLQQYYMGPNSSVKTIDAILAAMPQPKGKKKKKKAEDGGEAGGEASPEPGEKKAKKKKKKKVDDGPEFPKLLYGADLTPEQAQMAANSWKQGTIIDSKLSAGTLTTATYHKKVETYNKLNPYHQRSNVLPQANFFGREPDPSNDPFSNQKTYQIDEVELEEDGDFEVEDIKNLKRLDIRIMNEENFKSVITTETKKINLEAHYWLTTQTLSKIGLKAPNLCELSLRRMNQLNNLNFRDIFALLKNLTNIDLADCTGLYSSALQLCFRNNQNLQEIQLSGCLNAIDDDSVKLIAKLVNIQFIDISYGKNLTDKGLVSFAEKKLPIDSITLNGCTGISSAGLSVLIGCCSATLVNYEGAYLDQESMKSDVFLKFGQCWNLEYFDVSGCIFLDDNAFINMGKAEIMKSDGAFTQKPGLIKLATVKLQNCTKITDYGIGGLLKVAPNIQHLEINCVSLTEFGLKAIIKELRQIKFLDATGIKDMTFALMTEAQAQRPKLLMRKLAIDSWHKDDCGLRVPLRVVDPNPKKKKKAGGGKKGK